MDAFGTTYWTIDSGVSFMSKEVGGVRAPMSLMTIQPTFTIKDWAAASPIMAEFVEATKSEDGCIYYGWSKTNDKLFCREAYVDAAAVCKHLDNVGALVGKLLESAATLDGIELHGPYEELDKCKSKMDALGTTYWKGETSKKYGFSCWSKAVGGERTPMNLMTIQPTFTVKDWEVAGPIMAEFVEATEKEDGCIYYGWSKSDDKLFCREAYVDAAAVIKHLENVGALVGKLTESAAKLEKIELHGTAAELDKCKGMMDAFGTTYWTIDSGFQNFEHPKMASKV